MLSFRLRHLLSGRLLGKSEMGGHLVLLNDADICQNQTYDLDTRIMFIPTI